MWQFSLTVRAALLFRMYLDLDNCGAGYWPDSYTEGTKITSDPGFI